MGYFANKMIMPEDYHENFIMSALSVSSCELFLRTCSKVIEAFSDVSVKKSKIWKTIENANVDGEHLETKTLFSNVSGLM